MTNPTCFGKSWEARHVECNGGLDPAYVHPDRGDHTRDRCNWYSSCASRTAASRVQQPALVPAASLAKPPQAQPLPPKVQSPPQIQMPFPSMAPMQVMAQTAAQQVAARVGGIQVRPPQQQQQYQQPPPMQQPPQQQQQQPMPPQYQQPAQGMCAHPSAASVQYAVPVNYSAPGAQMPAYLTVPEPIIPGQSLTQPFVATMGRSVLKAMGHAAANWFDHVPWNAWPAPSPQ